MKQLFFVKTLFYIGIMVVLLVSVSTLCMAQIPFYYPPIYPFFNPFFVPYYPVPPVSVFPAPIVSPLFTPFTASIPTIANRFAAATIITLPAATPTVTAYAPLGTLNLTPSTLVFLILFLTLAE